MYCSLGRGTLSLMMTISTQPMENHCLAESSDWKYIIIGSFHADLTEIIQNIEEIVIVAVIFTLIKWFVCQTIFKLISHQSHLCCKCICLKDLFHFSASQLHVPLYVMHMIEEYHILYLINVWLITIDNITILSDISAKNNEQNNNLYTFHFSIYVMGFCGGVCILTIQQYTLNIRCDYSVTVGLVKHECV